LTALPLNIEQVTIIGSGNVASFFANLFQLHGIKIKNIVARNEIKGIALAQRVNATFSSVMPTFNENDLVLICVKDDAIASVSQTINGGLVCHTSGAQSIYTLQNQSNFGVIYPFQSILTNSSVSEIKFPFFIEANSVNTFEAIQGFLKGLPVQTVSVSSDNRLKYHLSAVFANNFSNAMLLAAQKICNEHQLDFNYLHPLISQSIQQALRFGPKNAQTGPAKRQDVNTMDSHLQLLENNEPLYELYKVMSGFINKEFNS
jgi:predicted short-subunit dehydrogenase-like oxidoreductase (DUF2520 family)